MSITETVSVFREGVELYAIQNPESLLRFFPRECCKTASILLARYLFEEGVGSASLIANGNRASVKFEYPETHCWLRVTGLIIDITAAQFGEQSLRVVIAKTTPFHKTFQGSQSFKYSQFMSFNERYKEEHNKMYHGIVAITSRLKTNR